MVKIPENPRHSLKFLPGKNYASKLGNYRVDLKACVVGLS